MLNYVKSKIRNYINSEIEKKIEEYVPVYLQMEQFWNAPDEMLASKVESKTNIPDLVERFETLGIPVRKTVIDITSFELWMKKYPELLKHYTDYGDVRIEKILEHYLTSNYLEVDKTTTYIDIAAAGSPFSNMLDKEYGGGGGGQNYCQDLIFKKGIHGNKIGGDAGELSLPENFVDIMALHCAYECFQGDADIRFIKEAARVLKPGGRVGIIPLYVDDVYFAKTGPRYDKRKVSVEPEARWIWRDDKFDKEPFSRHYSPESFKNRIIDNLQSMTAEIIYFSNLEELRNHYTSSRIYCHFMFRVTK
jgi:SAM-dependent methyltransferase